MPDCVKKRSLAHGGEAQYADFGAWDGYGGIAIHELC